MSRWVVLTKPRPWRDAVSVESSPRSLFRVLVGRGRWVILLSWEPK